jgi:HEAT repeat protein
VRELARGWASDPETLPWLKDLARSGENGVVRRAAVQELVRGWASDPETLPFLKDRARSDPDSYVRRAAVQELVRAGQMIRTRKN